MDKLKMHSLDGVARNIDLIGNLFPNAVTEVMRDGKVERAIDFDVLRQELSGSIVEGREERYQFTWPDKKKAMLAANAPITATLRPVAADSVGRDGTPGGFDSENLYIEGDNLEVLKLLQETYLGKVKMIYIDPPYNTGNDFVYDDDFAMQNDEFIMHNCGYDEAGNRMFKNMDTNGRFHTDWLNMIYPRLRLAKDLLAEDGVIFVSIDDNEQENLKKICDEIFGADNFIMQISWRRTDNQPNIGSIARVKEYILCFAKDKTKVYLNKLPLTDKARNEYRYSDERGQFRRAILLDKTRGRYHYPIKTKSGNILNGPWMKSEKEFRRLDDEDLVYWTSGGDEQPYGKIYLDETKGQIPNDFWGIEFGTNQRASLEVEKIFGARYFDFPKATSLIKSLVAIGSDSDSIIFDFFSGSATTAHAVIQLNAEDNGHRKFIMVQLPEACDEKSEAYKAGYKNICEIGKERIRRAGRKIKEDAGLTAPADLDIGFRCLRLDESNMQQVYYTPDAIGQRDLFSLVDNVKPDRTPWDLMFQVMLDLGILLSSPIAVTEIAGKKVFDVADGFLLACFDQDVTDETVKAIAKRKPYYAVFRDSSMSTDSVATNFDQIFETYSPDTVRKVL